MGLGSQQRIVFLGLGSRVQVATMLDLKGVFSLLALDFFDQGRFLGEVCHRDIIRCLEFFWKNVLFLRLSRVFGLFLLFFIIQLFQNLVFYRWNHPHGKDNN
jgi:hypothetical protein